LQKLEVTVLFLTLTVHTAIGCASLTRSEATNSYEVNATHDKPPQFCVALPEEEINGGNPYTMTVELMNVVGKNGEDHGHPGVMYNLIDENNFDSIHLRFTTWEKPTKADVCLYYIILLMELVLVYHNFIILAYTVICLTDMTVFQKRISTACKGVLFDNLPR